MGFRSRKTASAKHVTIVTMPTAFPLGTSGISGRELFRHSAEKLDLIDHICTAES